MEPNEQLAITLPTISALVAGLEPTQMGLPTPCAQFSVRGVVDHLLGGATVFTHSFRGDEPADSTTRGLATSSPAAEVPVAAVRAAMAGLLEAIDSPGAMERTIDSPFGQAPGSVVARFLAFDTLIHGWDLATATGQFYDPPADLVAAADFFARQAVGPAMRDGDTFALETVAPNGASQLERLVAFSGRTV